MNGTARTSKRLRQPMTRFRVCIPGFYFAWLAVGVSGCVGTEEMESDALDSANPTLSENEGNLHESLAVSTLPAHIAELAVTENWNFDPVLRWQRARSSDVKRLREDGGLCEVDDCGGPSSNASCYCDTWCDMFGDCCDNKADVCGPEYCESDAECGGPQYCNRQDLTCDGIGRCLSRPEL